MNEIKELMANVGEYAKTAILPTVLLLVIGILVIILQLTGVLTNAPETTVQGAAFFGKLLG